LVSDQEWTQTAARYDKTAGSYLGFTLVASIRLWVRRFVNST
jgi:transposase